MTEKKGKKKEIKSKSKNIKQKQKQTQIVNVNIEQKTTSKKRKYTKKTTNTSIKGIPTINTLFKYQQSNKAPIIMPPIMNNNELISEMKNILQVHNTRLPIQTTDELMRQQIETSNNLNNLVRQQNTFQTPTRITPDTTPERIPKRIPKPTYTMEDIEEVDASLIDDDAIVATDRENRKKSFLNRALNFASSLSPFSKKPEKQESNRGRPPDIGLAYRKYNELRNLSVLTDKQKKTFETAKKTLQKSAKPPQEISHIV